MRLSSRTTEFPCSVTVAISEKARQLLAAGVDVVALAAGEPELPVAPHIVEAARLGVAKGRSPYPPLTGSSVLREQIAQRLNTHARTHFSREGVVVTNGAKQAIYNACLALIDPQDRVVIPVPAWGTFGDAVRLSGGVVVELQTHSEDRFLVRPQALEAALKDAKGVIFNSPSNPTGCAYTESDWVAIADVLRGVDGFILLDEIYAELVFEGTRAPSLLKVAPDLADRTVVVSGVSKAYAMAGYRLGWAVAGDWLAEAIANFQSLTTSGASLIAQEAALAALTGPQDGVAKAALHYRERVRWAQARFTEVAGCQWVEPDGAFYLFVSVGGDDVILAHRLLDEAGVAVVPGRAFGCPGFVRLSLAGEESRVRLGIERMVKFMTTGDNE